MHSTVSYAIALACCGWLAQATHSADAAPDAASPVTLKAKWTTGHRMLHRVTAATKQKITLPDTDNAMEQATTQLQEYAVTVGPDLPGGGQELNLEFTTLQIESLLGSQTVMKFDSKADARQDADNPVGAMLRPLVGAKLRVLTTPSGKVDRVEGYQAIREQMTKNAPPMLASMLDGMFGENLVDQMGVIPKYLPEKPVQANSQWPLKLELSAGQLGTITLLGTTTFKNREKHRERDCVLLESKGRLWSVAKPGVAAIGSVSGDFRGLVWFDPKNGLQVESVSTQNLSVKITAAGREMIIPSVQVTTNLLVETGPAGR